MPKIPTYDSQLTPTTEAPATEHSYAPAVTAWRALEGVGSTMFNIAERFKRAEATQEAIQAGIQARREIGIVLDEAASSNETEKLVPTYMSRINQIKRNILSKVKDPYAKQEVQNSLDRFAVDAELRLRDLYRKKVIARGKEISAELDRQLAMEYPQAKTNVEKKNIIDSYMKAKNALKEAGIISQKDYDSLKYKVPVMIIEQKIANNPFEAVRDFSNGAFPQLKKEQPKIYEKLKHKAYTALQESRRIANEQLFDKFISGQLTFADIASEYEKGNISESQLKKWQGRFKDDVEGKPKEIRVTSNPEGFVDVINKIASGEEVSLDSLYDDGELTFKELASVNEFKKALVTLPEPNRNAIISYIKQVDGATNSDEAKAHIYSNLLSLTDRYGYDTSKIKEAINQTEAQRIHTKYPSTTRYPEIPDVIIEKGKPVLTLKFGNKREGGLAIYIPDKDQMIYFPNAKDINAVLGEIYNASKTEGGDKAHAELAKANGKMPYIQKVVSAAWNSALAKSNEIVSFALKSAFKAIMPFVSEGVSTAAANAELGLFSPKNLDKYAKGYNEYVNSLVKGESKLKTLGLQLASSGGAMFPDLMSLLTIGGMANAGIKGIFRLASLPAVINNEFVLGSLTESVYHNVLDDKQGRDALKQIESVAGDFASAYAIVHNLPALATPLKNFIARTLAFASIGTAHANYQSLVDRGKPLSSDENMAVIANNIGMGMAFETINAFAHITRDIAEKKALKRHISNIEEAIKRGEIDKIAKEINKVVEDKDVKDEAKQAVAKATGEGKAIKLNSGEPQKAEAKKPGVPGEKQIKQPTPKSTQKQPDLAEKYEGKPVATSRKNAKTIINPETGKEEELKPLPLSEFRPRARLQRVLSKTSIIGTTPDGYSTEGHFAIKKGVIKKFDEKATAGQRIERKISDIEPKIEYHRVNVVGEVGDNVYFSDNRGNIYAFDKDYIGYLAKNIKGFYLKAGLKDNTAFAEIYSGNKKVGIILGRTNVGNYIIERVKEFIRDVKSPKPQQKQKPIDISKQKATKQPKALTKKDKGETKLYSGVPIPLDKFYEHTLKPAGETLVKSITNLVKGLKTAFAPEGESKEAFKASMSIRKALAEKARKQTKFERESYKRAVMWDKAGKEANLEFIKAIEGGRKTGKPELDKLISLYRKILDEAYEMSKTLNKDIGYVKDYFPHIWKDPAKAKEFFGRYSKRMGKEGFSKERIYDLFDEALKAGLEPKFDNVEDYIAARYMSALQAKAKADMLDYLEKEGFLTKEKSPAMSQITTPKGIYYGDPAIIRLLERKLQPALWYKQGVGGEAYRGFMGLKNRVIRIKFGWNTFHAIFSTITDMANQAIIAAKKLGRGDIKGFAKELAKVPVSPVLSYKEGGKLTKAFLDELDIPEAQEFKDILTTAGGRIRMPSYYGTKGMRAVRKALAQGDVLGAGLRAVPLVFEGISRWILEKYVPNLKVAKFWQTYLDWKEAHPNATYEQRRTYATRLWDSIDNRLGELVYDNLFWHRFMRDLGIASTLSLGWNLGSVREATGAVKDLVSILKDLKNAENKDPHFVDRMLFVAIYPIVAGAIGGLATAILTGKPPKEAKDFFMPKDGGTNPDGSPSRLTLPAYTKDYFSYREAIRKNGLINGLLEVASHKANPLIGFATDMLRNKDFYGVMVRNPRSPLKQQAIDLGKFVMDFMLPISVSSAKRMSGDKTWKKIAPFLGFSKAPSYVTRTETQNRIYHILAKRERPAIPRSEWERRQKEKELIKEIKDKHLSIIQARSLLRKAIKEGILGDNPDTIRRRARRILKTIKYPPDVLAFGYLHSDEQKIVWEKMSDKEKVRYYPMLHKNIRKELLDKHIMKLIREAIKK